MDNHDLQLIKKAQKGNQTAISALYKYYEAFWFRLCLRYARNRSEAQDIFQEGTIMVFKGLGSFDAERGTFKNWSGRIIVNAALQYLKKYQWHQSFEDLNILTEEADGSQNSLGKLTVKELIEVVQKLPTGYRIVFNMYEIEGYNHREIAEALNISIGTSKSQLFKAKKMLRQKLNILF